MALLDRDEHDDLTKADHSVLEVVEDRISRAANGEEIKSLVGKPIITYTDFISWKGKP